MTMRLLIADDHELVREALLAICEPTMIEVMGEAATCEEAKQLATALDADVMPLDLNMPGVTDLKFSGMFAPRRYRPS